MGRLIDFPHVRRPRPTADSIRVAFDFGRRCVDFCAGGKMLERVPFRSERLARIEAAHLCATKGLSLLADAVPPPPTYGSGADSEPA